jgi:hypothetical protein
MFLLVLGWIKYIRKYYLTSVGKPLDKRIKSGALLSGLVVFIASVYFIIETYEYREEKVSKSFDLVGKQLNLKFKEQRPQNRYYRPVGFQIKTNELLNEKVIVHLNYSSEGRNNERAKQNIQTIQYYFTYAENSLELDSYWALDKRALNRSQDLDILIEVPSDMMISSNRTFRVSPRLDPLSYLVSPSNFETFGLKNKYLTSQAYFHEKDNSKISNNEKIILDDKFCKEFFISQSWGCAYNISTLVMQNNRLDRAYEKDIEVINQIREMLLPNRTLFISNIEEIKDLVKGLSIGDKDYFQQSEFNLYLQHLLQVKSKLNKEAVATD